SFAWYSWRFIGSSGEVRPRRHALRRQITWLASGNRIRAPGTGGEGKLGAESIRGVRRVSSAPVPPAGLVRGPLAHAQGFDAVGRQHAVADGEVHELDVIAQPELVQEMRAVGLHGARADGQLLGDAAAGIAPCREVQDLFLAAGQRLVAPEGG